MRGTIEITPAMAATIVSTWKTSAALRAEFAGNVDSYLAYVRGYFSGRIRGSLPAPLVEALQPQLTMKA